MRARTQHTTFPLFVPGLVPAMSAEPVLLEGMKVLFDEKVGLYPVQLREKRTGRKKDRGRHAR